MQYLDAKKRLAVMMATAKYLRLKMDADPSIQITNEDVKAAIALALHTVPKDYTITVEDIAIIRNGVRSILVKVAPNQVSIHDTLGLTTKRYGDLQHDYTIILKELVKLSGDTVSSLAAAELAQLIQTNGILNLALDHADYLMTDSKTLTTDLAEFNLDAITKIELDALIKTGVTFHTDIAPSALLKAEDCNSVADFVKLNEATPNIMSIKSAFAMLDQVSLELEEIRSSISVDESILSKASVAVQLLHRIQLKMDTFITINPEISINQDRGSLLETQAQDVTCATLSLNFLYMLAMALEDVTSLQHNVKLASNKAIHVVLEEKILANFDNKLVDSLAKHLGVNDMLFMTGSLALDFEQFIATDFELESCLYISDIVKLSKAKALPKEIIAKLYVPDQVKLSLLNGTDFKHDYTLTISDSVAIGRFKYSILQNFDEVYTTSLDDFILDDLIYIEQ